MEKQETFVNRVLRCVKALAFPLTLIVFLVVRENLGLGLGWYFLFVLVYGFYVSRRALVRYCRNWWITYKILTYKKK